jgi:glycosyltransferase involved in cell wall biosynthesis
MRVLLAQDTFFPRIGGAEVHVWELCKALRALGDEVVIVTTTPGPPEFQGVPVYRFPLLRGQGVRALAALPACLPRLTRLVAHHDVIHGHYTALLSAVVGTLAKRFQKRFVLTLHGYATLESSVRQSTWLRVWRRACFRAAGAVIATSREIEDVALRFVVPSRVTFIPNGVDTGAFAPRPVAPPPPVRIISVRRLVPKNGVQYLVEAAPVILRESPVPVRFCVVGDGPLRGYLTARSQELGVASAIRFSGALLNHEVRDALADAHIAVFPSSAESTSIAALEAMSMAKAIVASNVGGFPELLGKDERGLLVRLFERTSSDYAAPLRLPAERIRRLADAVLRLIADHALAMTLGHRARAYVQEHMDWNVLARRVVDLYGAPSCTH